MNGRAGTLIFWGGLALIVLVMAIIVVGGTNEEPLDPRSTSPDGAKGLVDLARSFDADVVLGLNLPDAKTQVAVVLRDSYGVADRQVVENWVRDGGRLLIADPSSPLTPATSSAIGDIARGRCATPALAGVREIAGATSRFLSGSGVTLCADDAVAVQPLGSGVIVSVAGAGPLLNENLDRADNAVLAVAVLAPGDGALVAVLEPRLPVGDAGERLVDLIPDVLWVLLAQVGVAFLLVAWWKARRLGAPVAESVPVTIEGSELAVARGRLLESTRQPAGAADDLRADTRRRLLRRLGLPPDVPTAVLADRIAASTSLDAAAVAATLDSHPITNDTELVALAAELGHIRDVVLTIPQEAP